MIPNEGSYKCSTLEGDPICEGNGECVTLRDGEMIFSYSNSHSVAIVLQALRGVGFLILAPGDASPLGELVRAAAAFGNSFSDDIKTGGDLTSAAVGVAWDPAVRAWVEKKP